MEANTLIKEKTLAEIIKSKADAGNTSAMCAYADMLKNGNGVLMDKIEAAKYYKMAADRGNNRGMYGYGSMVYNGDGIPKNRKRAAYYFEWAAETGHVNAMNKYGLMLINGEEVKKNKGMGFNYIKMAADKGNSDALFNLGLMYQCGWIKSENKEKAANYYKQAIAKGNADAMINYASMLNNGDGIKKNKNEALKYYKMAADKGNLNSLKLFGNIDEIGKLIKYIEEENIIRYAYESKMVRIENQKIIEIYRINDGRQGENQVKTKRQFKYDNSGNLIGIKDKAYNKKTGGKLYEIIYKKDNSEEIRYFDINGRPLITANINSDGIISFNVEGNNLKHLQREVNKIINSFDRGESRSFDHYLSYLAYLSLLKEEKGENIIINVGCKSFDDLLKKINESSEQENTDKIYICDFGTKEHNVQVIASNGFVNIVNTGIEFDEVKKEINERFQVKFPDKKINIAEFKFLNQETGNCVLASKICLVNLLKQVREYNKKAKKMVEAEIKLNKLPEMIYNFNKFIDDYDKYETAKCLEQLNLFKTNSKANQNMINILNENGELIYIDPNLPTCEESTDNKNYVTEKPVLQDEYISLMEIMVQTMMYTNKHNENAFLEIDKKFDNFTDKLYQQTPKGQAEREKNERRNTHNNNTRQGQFKSNREKRAEIKANEKKLKAIRDDFDGKSACCCC